MHKECGGFAFLFFTISFDMLLAESFWYRDTLMGLPAGEISPILNIGSSTLHFRTQVQPFIDANIFAPLTAAGYEVLHLDMKPDEGVDIVGDLTDTAFQQKLITTYSAKLFLCSNLLEHIASPGREQLCVIMQDLLPQNGYLLVSVPYDYPYHKDPIDTMFRPDVQTLASLFPALTLVKGEIVVRQDVPFKDIIRRMRGTLVNTLHVMFPSYFRLTPAEVALEKKSIPYWRRKYSVCCVLLQKK